MRRKNEPTSESFLKCQGLFWLLKAEFPENVRNSPLLIQVSEQKKGSLCRLGPEYCIGLIYYAALVVVRDFSGASGSGGVRSGTIVAVCEQAGGCHVVRLILFLCGEVLHGNPVFWRGENPSGRKANDLFVRRGSLWVGFPLTLRLERIWSIMKYLSALLFALVLVAGPICASGEIAFVDLQEVFKRFYKTQLAQDQIRQQADDIKMERDEIEGEVEVMKEAIEVLRADSRDTTLSDEIRANKRDQLEEKLVALQEKENEAAEFEKLRREQMEQQNTRMTKKLFDEIHEVVIVHAKSKGYSAVIDRSAQSRIGTDNVLYVSPKVDITADVLVVLNEGRETAKEMDVEDKDGE